MRQHHLGGIHMAQAILELSDNKDVTWLAETMVTGQQGEINLIDDLLEEAPGHSVTARRRTGWLRLRRRLLGFSPLSPRSSGDRASPSGGESAGSNPAGGTI